MSPMREENKNEESTMNLIISFSARQNGNCDSLANYIATEQDKIIYFRELNIHSCGNCNYECFQQECVYREDDIYQLYHQMCDYGKVILLVPMYCGNPCSLYFIFNERCQDYFMHNDTYEEIQKRLYIIGIYGSREETPDFLPCFEKWYNCGEHQNRVLGIERHRYGQKMGDCILDVEDVKEQVKKFLQ